jgi:hypothetical protein
LSVRLAEGWAIAGGKDDAMPEREEGSDRPRAGDNRQRQENMRNVIVKTERGVYCEARWHRPGKIAPALFKEARSYYLRWMVGELRNLLEDVQQFSREKRWPSPEFPNGPTYTKVEAWGMVCRLLDVCADLGLPPPRKLRRAIYLLADEPPRPPDGMDRARGCEPELAELWRRAVAYEARQLADPAGKKPSSASTKAMATEFGVARDTIRRWRASEHYRSVVEGCRRFLNNPDEILD